MTEIAPTAVNENEINPPLTQNEKSSSARRTPLILGALVVLVICILGYVTYAKNTTKNPTLITQVVPTATTIPVTPTPTLFPTPIISPVTKANADQTLSTTDTSLQQSVNQANTDLQSLNTIDSSQDNTNTIQ